MKRRREQIARKNGPRYWRWGLLWRLSRGEYRAKQRKRNDSPRNCRDALWGTGQTELNKTTRNREQQRTTNNDQRTATTRRRQRFCFRSIGSLCSINSRFVGLLSRLTHFKLTWLDSSLLFFLVSSFHCVWLWLCIVVPCRDSVEVVSRCSVCNSRWPMV